MAKKGIDYTNPLNGQKSNTYQDAKSLYNDYGNDPSKMKSVRDMYAKAASMGSAENRKHGKDIVKHLDAMIANGGKSKTNKKPKTNSGKKSGNKSSKG